VADPPAGLEAARRVARRVTGGTPSAAAGSVGSSSPPQGYGARVTTNDEQAKIWNESAGDAWVTHADHFDATLSPFGEAVIDRLAPAAGHRLIDIGCGTGATTIRLASLVAPGTVTGVDLSVAMLAAARSRAAVAGVDNAGFVECDVQSDDIPSGPFDLAFSRFGVMFFSDPVAAFSRIADRLVEAGRLGFVCFQSPIDNPFIAVPVMTAAAHLAVGGPPVPDGPSPFSLADPNRTRFLLADAGFDDIQVTPGPDRAVLGTDDDLEEIARRAIEQNPMTAAPFATAAPDRKAATLDAVVAALRPHCSGGLVALGAATWIVTATRR
jgi:SAM-dependent methyltransferase